MAKLVIRRSLRRRLTSLLTVPAKWLARRMLRTICFRGRYGMMYFYFYSYVVATCTYAVAKLGIPDLLADGPKTADELAGTTGSDRETLFRILRALAGFNVLDQDRAGRFSLTPLGELLLSDHPDSLRYWGLHFGDDILPALPRVLEQLETGVPAFEQSHGMKLWDFLSADAERERVFVRKMSLFTEKHIAAILKVADFSGVGTLADIGGGCGALLAAILQRHPHLRGLLYERPEVVSAARERFREAGVAERCEVVGGNFLESVPRGADAYLLKHVLHDWHDAGALAILQNVRAAVEPGQKLYIIEGSVGHNLFGWDGYRRWCDVYQMLCLPGRERTLDQFDALLARAGFQLDSLTPTSIVDVAILEATAVGLPVAAPGAEWHDAELPELPELPDEAPTVAALVGTR
ncbi:MAG: methyltransferase [Planctomycetes bacterium]|nr:methyltransferase [Planctomycetota bacterium]